VIAAQREAPFGTSVAGSAVMLAIARVVEHVHVIGVFLSC